MYLLTQGESSLQAYDQLLQKVQEFKLQHSGGSFVGSKVFAGLPSGQHLSGPTACGGHQLSLH